MVASPETGWKEEDDNDSVYKYGNNKSHHKYLEAHRQQLLSLLHLLRNARPPSPPPPPGLIYRVGVVYSKSPSPPPPPPPPQTTTTTTLVHNDGFSRNRSKFSTRARHSHHRHKNWPQHIGGPGFFRCVAAISTTTPVQRDQEDGSRHRSRFAAFLNGLTRSASSCIIAIE